MVLRSAEIRIGDLERKSTDTVQLQDETFFDSSGRSYYFIGKSVSFTSALSMGFNKNSLSVFENKLLFSTSSKKLSILNMTTKQSINFECKLEHISYSPVYSNNNGCLLIGGRNCNEQKLPNQTIQRLIIDSDTKKALQKLFTKLPHSVIWPSVYVLDNDYDDKLFIFGGWWNSNDLSSCYMYNETNAQWIKLKNMNKGQQSAGICYWEEKQSMIVAAGYNTGNYNEKYDVTKNLWIDLPHLNKSHPSSPVVVSSNNIIFCIGGAKVGGNNLGFIEMYDPRNRENKWILVDSVKNYFNIEETSVAGYNSFLQI